MFKIISLCLVLTISNTVFSKTPVQGVAIYKQTINIHASLPKSQAALKAMIPEYQFVDSKTSFNNNIMRFESVIPSDDSSGEPKIGSVRMMSTGDENVVFNANKKIVSQYGNVMDIDYIIIHDTNKVSGLIFTDETKIINGYSCKKVIDEIKNTIIWYQESNSVIIPSQGFINIPGVVVKVEGKISYDLISIKESTLDAGYFDVPKNYKEITQEQFQDLQEEAMEEMMSSLGSNSKIIRSKVK